VTDDHNKLKKPYSVLEKNEINFVTNKN